MTLPHFVQSLGDAPSLRSVAGGCSLTSFSRWGDAPLLRSVAGGMLPHFVQSLGGCSLASLSHWGMLPHFVQSLGVLFASLRHWGDAPHFAQLLSIQWFHQIAAKFAFLIASRATLLHLGASLWVPPEGEKMV